MRLCIYLTIASRFELPETAMFYGVNSFLNFCFEKAISETLLKGIDKERLTQFIQSLEKCCKDRKELSRHIQANLPFATGAAPKIEHGIDRVFLIIECVRDEEPCPDTYKVEKFIKYLLQGRYYLYSHREMIVLPLKMDISSNIMLVDIKPSGVEVVGLTSDDVVKSVEIGE